MKGDYMNNDIIRLLNLEDINVDFEKSDVIKINNVLLLK